MPAVRVVLLFGLVLLPASVCAQSYNPFTPRLDQLPPPGTLLGVVPDQLFDGLRAGLGRCPRCRASTVAQALEYECCRSYPLHTIREDLVKIEHARHTSERAKDDRRRDNYNIDSNIDSGSGCEGLSKTTVLRGRREHAAWQKIKMQIPHDVEYLSCLSSKKGRLTVD
jgi:hypothetical protein